MKKHLSFVWPVLILALSTFLLHAADILTQQDVLKLLELKIPEQTIIDKVKSSGTAFVLGSEDIAHLKKAGASDALITAMQGTGSVPATRNPASEITDLALIIDYSGSMNAKMKDGQAKVVSAKKCVTELIDKLPNDLNVALIVYGTSKKRGCEDIDIVQPLGPIDKAGLKSKINGFNATGMTPIATSLARAGEELKKAKGGSAIVLVTDGAESCHGDPAAVAAKLAAEFGVKFGINVIGFGIEPKEKAELAEIASKGRGKLLTVENASELANALQKVVAEKVKVAPEQRESREYEASGAAAKPGAFFGDAPSVAAGDYKGELAMKEAKYYSVSLRKGQELRAIVIVKKTPYEAMNKIVNQTFSLTIYDKNLNSVAREKMEVSDNPNDPISFRATWTADADSPAYIAIAASDNHDSGGAPAALYKNLNPNPSPYTLKIKIEGESAGAGSPAAAISRVQTAGGAGFGTAAELKPPVLVSSDLKIDETEFFKFAVKKGDVVEAGVAVQKPWYRANNSAIKATYTLKLYDDDQVQVAEKKIDISMNPPDAQTMVTSWPATISGNAYLSISCANSGQAIYPKEFEPGPGRLSVLVTTEGSSVESSQSETQPPNAKPGEGPQSSETPAPTKAPSDPFAGAESTPGK